jgi:membrane fusion protein, copper/silver efflux system
MNNYRTILIVVAFAIAGCKTRTDKHSPPQTPGSVVQYTCPMKEDSVFSDHPGSCPKCGMELVKVETGHAHEPGMESLLKPTNEFVVSEIPVVSIEKRAEQMEVESFGVIGYDTREAGSISARISGRVEKLFVKYRYQKINKGQRILDLYSPELVTAQENFLFLMQQDPGNSDFIRAAREKILLLGMSPQQLDQVISSGRPAMTIAVYSQYDGHVHESVKGGGMQEVSNEMKDISRITEELTLKEGMYVQKGQSIFTVFNPARAWAVLNIFGENQSLVKQGNSVRVIPETAPGKDFRATISFVEPFFRKESKTLTARVNFNNAVLQIPVGSQVKATIFANARDAYWLPREAVLSLGLDKVVFLRSDGGFRAHRIQTGIVHKGHIQVSSGLGIADSVAANAQYLMDSESFIKIKS